MAVRMTSRGEKSLLGDHNVVGDENVILIVEPDSLADPRVATDVKFPREFHSCSRAKFYTVRNLCTKQAEYPNSESGTDLPRVRHEQQFDDSPHVN
jgi:hypothetical protein